MMNKKKFSLLAAVLLTAAVVAGGCNQQQQVAPDPTPNPTPTPTPTPDTNTGSAIEFTGNLEIGQVVVSINNGMVAVWYRRSPDNTVYVGNGTVGAKGAVSFDLHAVDNAADKIPFAGTYHYTQATGVQTFELTQLTASYPYAPVPLTNKHQGNVAGYQKNFVRYVENLKNGLNGKNDIAATFFITLDTDKVQIVAVYGNSDIGMASVSKSANLEGNVVRTKMKLGKAEFLITLKFNEDTRDGSGNDDDNTVWYLGSRNDRYVSPEQTPNEPEYIGGFYISEGVEKGTTTPLLRDDQVVEHRGLKLYTANNAKELGTLDVIIRGPKVTFIMRQTDNQAVAGESAGVIKEKHIMLFTGEMAKRPPYYDTKAMDTAVENETGGVLRETDERVFVFTVHTDPAGTLTNYTYNTYDFKITEYDPVTKRLCLTGRCLLGKKVATENAGKKLIVSTAVAGAESIYIQKSGLQSQAMDGGVLF